MRRILIINTVNFYRQGISSVIMNYYRVINHDKYKIDFVANGYMDSLYRKEIESVGGKIFVLERDKTAGYFRKLVSLIKENKLAAAKFAGCETRIAHSHNTTCTHLKAHKFLKPFFDLLVTDQLACSEEAGVWLFGKKKFKVINNAVNPDDYRYDPVKRSLIRHE